MKPVSFLQFCSCTFSCAFFGGGCMSPLIPSLKKHTSKAHLLSYQIQHHLIPRGNAVKGSRQTKRSWILVIYYFFQTYLVCRVFCTVLIFSSIICDLLSLLQHCEERRIKKMSQTTCDVSLVFRYVEAVGIRFRNVSICSMDT